MFLLLLVIVFIFCVVLSGFYLWHDCKRINVPGPMPIPLLGNALLFIGDSAHFLKAISVLHNKYGPNLKAFLFNQRYVLLSDPKYIENLMSSSELTVKGRSYRFLWPWLGMGLLTSSGNRWRAHRKFLTPAFHFNILQNFLPVFCKNGKVLCDKMSRMTDGRDVNLFPIVALAALDNITESIMGISLDVQKDTESEYVKSIEELTEIISLKQRSPFIAEDITFNLTPLKKRQDKALKILHGETEKVIEARRKELKKNNITSLPDDSDTGIKNKHAFLDLLLLSEVDGKKISDENVREEVDTFMFEGHDTTTSGISFCLYCLSRHEKYQEKILEEQKNVLGDDFYRDPTYTELSKMKFLEMVIKESLRLFPSVPLIERMIVQDTVSDGIFLPKNTSVIVNILSMQRSPDVYEDPLTFKPERFDANLTRNAFSWIPFSAGPRNCIGQKFAMMEMKVTISAIIKRFRLLPGRDEPELSADLILRSKHGVQVRILPRNN